MYISFIYNWAIFHSYVKVPEVISNRRSSPFIVPDEKNHQHLRSLSPLPSGKLT